MQQIQNTCVQRIESDVRKEKVVTIFVIGDVEIK
jgi:ribosomal protein S25